MTTERLRDLQGSADPVLERASRLLRNAEPMPPSNELKRRVRASIAFRSVGRFRSSSGWGTFVHPSFAATIIVLSAAAAGATIGRGWIQRTFMPASAPFETPAAPAAAAPLARAGTGSPTAAIPVAAETPAANTESDRNGAAAAAAIAKAPREEAGVVLSAMTALRRDRDAAKAGKLLDGYLAHYPNGVLREEALALAIEAASSRADARTSERLGRAYLRSFPNGRFQDLAHAAVAP